MTTRKKLMLVVVAAGVLLAGRCACRTSPSAGQGENRPIIGEVKQGELVIAVKGSGSIQAQKASKIIPKIKREASISLLIPEGTGVKSNEVVASFVTDDMERRLSELESGVTDTQSKFDSAKSEREIQAMDNATSQKKAEQELSAARLELEKFNQGDEPMERRTAELKVQTATSECLRKEKRLTDLQGLLKEGFVTEDEVEEERVAVEAARVALDTAKIELKVLNDYTLPLKRANASNAVERTTSELEKALKQNATRLQTKGQAVELATRALERSQKDLGQARREREAFEVRAPTDGVVMYGDPDQHWRRGDVQVGSKLYPGQVLMTIPDMSAMQAVVNVPEADIFKVQTGQTARITVDAISSKPLPGRVAKVSEVANPDGWWSSGVKEFKVEIALSSTQALKPGFSCEAEIVTETIPECLYVPVQAVFQEKDAFWVYPAKSEGRKKVEVKVGRSSTQFAEILSGVKAGVSVLLSRPTEERK